MRMRRTTDDTMGSICYETTNQGCKLHLLWQCILWKVKLQHRQCLSSIESNTLKDTSVKGLKTLPYVSSLSIGPISLPTVSLGMSRSRLKISHDWWDLNTQLSHVHFQMLVAGRFWSLLQLGIFFNVKNNDALISTVFFFCVQKYSTEISFLFIKSKSTCDWRLCWFFCGIHMAFRRSTWWFTRMTHAWDVLLPLEFICLHTKLSSPLDLSILMTAAHAEIGCPWQQMHFIGNHLFGS